MTDQELKDLVASLAIDAKKRDAETAKRDAESAERDKRWEKEHREWREEMAVLNRNQGIHNNNTGKLTEEYFYNALRRNKQLGDIVYDEVEHNWQSGIKGDNSEYDIVLINGNSIAMIEVKTLATLKDIKKLLNKQLPRFKQFFPQYKDYDLYVGLASFYANDKIRNFAKENGIYLLERFGDHIETISGDIRHW